MGILNNQEVENYKIQGWVERWLRYKGLTLKAQGPELDPQNLCVCVGGGGLSMKAFSRSPSTGKIDPGGLWGLLANQPSIGLGAVQASERQGGWNWRNYP